MDTLTREQRRERMSRIRSRDTKPELAVRRLVYGLGFRYRLNVRELPGQPDLVFPSRRKIIFVHGCFWHRHI
jgi:DNA mismatch endonuclease (patch repair protein)